MRKIVLLMFAVVLLGSTAFAGQKTGYKRGKIHQDMIRELNLSPEQVELMHKQKTKNLKKRLEIQNKIKIAMIDLQEELRAKDLDSKKINKIADVIGDLQKDLFVQRVDSVIELRSIFNEEQLEKARAMALFRIGHMERGKKGPF